MARDDYVRLSSFLAVFRLRIALAAALITGNAVLAVLPAFLTQRLIDDGAIPGDTGRVYALGGALLAAGAVTAGSALTERWMLARLGEEVSARMRTDLYEHLHEQSAAFFAGSRAGAIVSRLHGDVQGVRDLVTRTLATVVSALVTLVVAGAAILLLNWRVALAVLCLAPVFHVLTTRSGSTLRVLTRRQLAATADLDSMAAERLSPGGAETIRLYGDRRREADRFRQHVHRLRDVTVRGAVLDGKLGAALTLLVALVTTGVYTAAGVLVARGSLTVGTMVAMVALLARIYGPLTALPGCRLELAAGEVSFERVREIMRYNPDIVEHEDAKPVPGTSVTFTDVTFAYPHETTTGLASLKSAPRAVGTVPAGTPREILGGVTFEAAPGTTVGVVGHSGAGKSTLAYLLTRSWDIGSGRIEVGGQDVRRTQLRSLRSTVGVVTQNTFLLHGTVRENLQLARPLADENDIVDACRVAQIWNAVERLPNGLDTVLGDQGVNLSGGERQRLAIARLVLKAPRIVVLDEATSQLDNITERALLESLRPFLSGRTCLIIAHRLSTVREADQILVMRDGRVVQAGTHSQLIAAEGEYRHMSHTQKHTADSGADGSVARNGSAAGPGRGR
ncbi:ABC transporter ATP-binding protein [Streptomyces sp. NPDC059479]|uniref:ABC transporter ATP-binding protein n=1 Tax=Streptomyces sp. NPDC059479 TaxID=3346848 RepID=UPI0036C438DE